MFLEQDEVEEEEAAAAVVVDVVILADVEVEGTVEVVVEAHPVDPADKVTGSAPTWNATTVISPGGKNVIDARHQDLKVQETVEWVEVLEGEEVAWTEAEGAEEWIEVVSVVAWIEVEVDSVEAWTEAEEVHQEDVVVIGEDEGACPTDPEREGQKEEIDHIKSRRKI